MPERLSPEFFCGSAIAALTGLLFGLMLHIPWQKHPGGPQILFARAEAAEARPDHDGAADTAASRPVDLADADDGPVPPDPLPVVRLRPEMFDVRPATAEEAERQDVDGLLADDVPTPADHDLD